MAYATRLIGTNRVYRYGVTWTASSKVGGILRRLADGDSARAGRHISP